MAPSGAAQARPKAQARLGPGQSGNLEIRRSGDLEIHKFGDLGTWKSRNLESKKLKNRNSQNPTGLAGKKKHSWLNLGPSQAIFPWTEKSKKMHKLCLFSLVGQWALFTIRRSPKHEQNRLEFIDSFSDCCMTSSKRHIQMPKKMTPAHDPKPGE